MFGALALPACTSEPAPTPQPSSSTVSERGGVYRIAGPDDAITLDPARANGIVDAWLAGTVLFNRLYSYDAQGNLYPDLAVALPQVSADGLTHTIALRPGVKFHNGRTLTSADVAFTFDRLRDPATASWALHALDNVAAVTAVDSGTVRFQLRQPHASFPAILSWSAMGIVPRNEVLLAGRAWGGSTAIGTGPFKLATWKRGEAMRLERHVEYFRPGQPRLDAVELSFNVVAPVALERWQEGLAEFAWFTPGVDEARAAAEDPEVSASLRTAPSLTVAQLWLNARNAVLADTGVRQAVAAAIDRSALARQLGRAFPTYSLFPSPTAYGDGDAGSAAAAAALPAGFDRDVELTLLTSEAPESISTLIADLERLGLKLRVVRGDPGQYAADIDSGAVAMVFAFRRVSSPDPSSAFGSGPGCDRAMLLALCADDVAALVQQAEAFPFDAPERAAMLQRAHDSVVEEQHTVIPLVQMDHIGLGAAAAQDDAIDPLFGLPSLGLAWVKRP